MPTVATTKGSSNVMNAHASGWAHGALTSAAGAPTISSFTPTIGSEGDTVTITGTNFDGFVQVVFHSAIVATVVSQTSTTMVVTVPVGATTGTFTVTNTAGSVTSSTSFVVGAAVGVAPDYSSLVTRESLGFAGAANEDRTAQLAHGKIHRLDCQLNTITNHGDLSAGVNAAATTFSLTVNSATYGPPSTPYTAYVGDEQVTVTAQSGTGSSRSLTVTRGVNGTTAASHSSGDGVTSFNWSGVDAKIKKILDANREVLLLITYNSRDYSGYSTDKAVPTKNGGAVSDANGHTFDQWVAWWSWVAAQVMQRYSRYGNANPTSGVLNGLISSSYCVNFVEVYNEFNNIQFWNPNNTGNFLLKGNTGALYDYAELMAAAYDAIKTISAGIYVGNGGFAARKIGYASNGVGPVQTITDLCTKWDVMNYAKHANGWANIPLDFVCHHAYAPNGRGGASQTSTVATSPLVDAPYNLLLVATPKIHNVLTGRGFGSLKIWCTESDNNWSQKAVTNYGYRGEAGHFGTYTQVDTPFPNYDRTMHSPQEEYDSERKQMRVWTNADAWPARTDNHGGYLPRWDILGKDTPTTADPLPLGPRFHFASSSDFNVPGGVYTIPYQYEEHFGLWDKDGVAKVADGVYNPATDKSPHDLWAQFPLKP